MRGVLAIVYTYSNFHPALHAKGDVHLPTKGGYSVASWVKSHMGLHNHPWLRLIGYCMFAGVTAALALAIVFAGATVTFAVGQSDAVESAAQSSFTGMVTDDHCGAKHDRYPGKNASECARMCALNGSKYVLLDGDNVYTLVGKDLALDKLAGQRATVIGTLQGTVINVSSVAAQHP
jgi:hypothetical protein